MVAESFGIEESFIQILYGFLGSVHLYQRDADISMYRVRMRIEFQSFFKVHQGGAVFTGAD